MKKDDGEFCKKLSLTPDEDDLELHKLNCDPKVATQRLRELVPLLETVGCSVEEIGSQKTVLSLPLLASAMNQNGTHQAAVFYLVADYTLGVGMFGVLPGCYVTGIHDRCRAMPVQYWLKQGSVKHLAPGTGRMRAEVTIPPEDALRLRRQLVEKGRGELSGVVRIYQGTHIVAEAHHTMGIYTDVQRNPGIRANLFQVQNMKTSALMICGLREDTISLRIAQDQGRAIASRMTLVSPQLPSLVRARTLDLERHLEHEGQNYSQVLVLGVGFDTKPVRFSNEHQRWFGVDLREMHKERERRFTEVGANARSFVPVIGDMLNKDWEIALANAGFASDEPTLIIAEGISMYFSVEALREVFSKLRSLVSSPRSRLWVDHVTSGLFNLELLEVRSFLSSMARLGEPFITGSEDLSTIMPGAWAVTSTTTASAAVGLAEPVHNEYRFSLLQPV